MQSELIRTFRQIHMCVVFMIDINLKLCPSMRECMYMSVCVYVYVNTHMWLHRVGRTFSRIFLKFGCVRSAWIDFSQFSASDAVSKTCEKLKPSSSTVARNLSPHQNELFSRTQTYVCNVTDIPAMCVYGTWPRDGLGEWHRRWLRMHLCMNVCMIACIPSLKKSDTCKASTPWTGGKPNKASVYVCMYVCMHVCSVQCCHQSPPKHIQTCIACQA